MRLVASDTLVDELQAFWNEYAVGGKVIPTANYNGTWYQLPDGSRIGWRLASKTTRYPTIDVKIGGRQTTIQVQQP